jgi:hypothetical protein
VNHEIPDWLCDLIARLHAKNPADRFQSARDVAELLGQQLALLQQPGRTPGPGALKKLAPAAPVRKRRRVGVIVCCLMLLVLGVGLFLAYRAGWLSRSGGPVPEMDGSDSGKAPSVAEKKPVPREVLEGLRLAVKAQQEHFDSVQANFDAGRLSAGELCAAKDLLIEARIKLATAEQKPVTAMLEDLVRNREEALRIAELLVEVGRTPESEASLARARLSDARARLAAARAGSP